MRLDNAVALIQKFLRKQSLDALWIISPANRRYCTGFSGSAGWVLLPCWGKPHLITDSRYQIQAIQECPGVKITVSQDPHKILAEIIAKKNIQAVGIEDDQLSLKAWKKAKQQIPNVRWKAASGIIENFRMVKTGPEVSCLKRAVEIAQQAYHLILKRIKPGMQEKKLAYELEQKMLFLGAESIAFPTIIASGKRSAMPHAQPTDKPLKAGELLIMDFGCCYQGYHSDLTRTVAIARMTARQKEAYKIVKNAQKKAQKHLISGQFAADSDKAARAVFQKSGMEKHFTHSLGHGLGLEVHEAPRLSVKNNQTLESNMVVTCEPGLYFPEWGGIRIEDDICIKPQSGESLSQSPEDLVMIALNYKK